MLNENEPPAIMLRPESATSQRKVLWQPLGEITRNFTVTDVRGAFLCTKDDRESKRNTTATTVKYSFNGDRFVSLFKTA